MDQLIGRTIAHYRIDERLGEGGMGIVYGASDDRLSRRVAIKVLRADRFDDPDRERRFIQEARAASALNHPNIITIYDIGSSDDVVYIAMEYVVGRTLDKLIEAARLPLRDVLKYAVQMADALAAAHEAGIVHRDLKPANVMITDKGRVKVLDFGLAKLIQPRGEAAQRETRTHHATLLTAEGAIVGTVAYMSPEQAQSLPLDARTDIFSLGAMLYEMIGGQRAFQKPTTVGTLSAILTEEPVPLTELVPDLPREVERLVVRCLRKEVERRPQHMGDLKLELEELADEWTKGTITSGIAPAIPGRASSAPPIARQRPMLRFPALAVVLLIAVVAWMLAHRQRPEPRRVLSRMTSDSGLSAYPALSPDGRLVAYASDRAGEGSLDIWVRQVAGGDPIRLTRDPEDEYEPSFSADGSSVVFRSERQGGGVYIVSALGGEARLIAPRGRQPRFSPDGKWIAFWTGATGGEGFGEQLHIVSRSGDVVRRLVPEFGSTAHPVWSPDGQWILFLGKRDPAARWPETADWYVVSPDDGRVASTGAYELFGRAAFDNLIAPDIWIPEQNRIVFGRAGGDTTNLWDVGISPRTGKLSGPPRQLTFGTAFEVQASADRDQLAFCSLVENADVWALPIDADRARVTGPLQRLTTDTAQDVAPKATLDGQTIVFASNRQGNHDIWLYEVATGRQRALTKSETAKMYPVPNADGSKVAYGTISNQQEIYVIPSSGGLAEKVCGDCGLARSWSPDGRLILFQGGQPRRLGILDLESRSAKALIRDPRFSVFSGSISPDGQWLAFFRTAEQGKRRIYIAPFGGWSSPLPIPESSWIAVTPGDGEVDKPRWSPDARTIYYTSLRDGFNCVWAQRLDPATHAPAGDPIAVHHFHQARLSMMNVRQDFREVSVARDKIVFALTERTGNIWLFRPEQ